MTILYFAAFLLVSHLMLMQVYRITTYHAYFWKALPFLLGFSVAVGALLYYAHLHAFFLWFVVLESIWLIAVARKQSRAADAMLSLAGGDADVVRAMAWSTARTKTYYAASSVIYIVAASLAYLYLYNR